MFNVVNPEWDTDKQAHVFYGMPPELYDYGIRYDWNSIKDKALPNGDIQLNWALLKNGKPLVIRMEGVRTQGVLMQGLAE